MPILAKVFCLACAGTAATGGTYLVAPEVFSTALVSQNSVVTEQEQVAQVDHSNHGETVEHNHSRAKEQVVGVQEKEVKLEVPREQAHEKFEGKLVLYKTANDNQKWAKLQDKPTYQGILLAEDNFKQEEAKWIQEDEDDKDPEDHIYLEVKDRDTKEKLDLYLEGFNKGLETVAEERDTLATTELLKLKKYLGFTETQNNFERVFGPDAYKALLAKIELLIKGES
ncbi:hypothetical protein MHLP_04435 [Candidatus Mycoplasma haematolamae str. Purdue]|uniref:Uncharacterized protein n=1 Tax=Mycoplasma haematolamae (strain Purdue) TaxID=1212765 RepID=I7C7F8_MYCHA|nr:hypothetical protein [Candidatus Mycoplasma haematolamae]AFO52467.1 hypothetical protein MHLP_04435 [Candidatus Mycoplasma haematolamae str. Purdue]